MEGWPSVGGGSVDGGEASGVNFGRRVKRISWPGTRGAGTDSCFARIVKAAPESMFQLLNRDAVADEAGANFEPSLFASLVCLR